MTARRVVVFGGTFDPVHNGHIAIAKCLRDQLEAESVVMIPTGRPWLRPNAPIATPSDRLRMVELAIKSESRIKVSNVDVVRDKTTYSIDTINDLRPQYGVDHEFILAIGTDAVPDLHRWHRFDELIEECTFAVVERPGSPLNPAVALPRGSLVVPGPMIDVSASEIRAMIGRGEVAAACRLLPTEVREFIINSKMYYREPPIPT